MRCVLPVLISIHALRGEGDKYANEKRWISRISIHALRGEGDWTFLIYMPN